MAKREDTPAVEQLLEAWGLGPPQPLQACPRCGRMPQLVSLHNGRGEVKQNYQCVRWWGLKKCFIGPAHWEDQHWTDFGGRAACAAWNRKVAQFEKLTSWSKIP